ncbi:permeability factor 2 [Pelodiscus sinensis]|uniref:permeability factor 2 n=1 Tax=Pelodiscus sinensis TaxID=13735 RepID=UPI003F6B7627
MRSLAVILVIALIVTDFGMLTGLPLGLQPSLRCRCLKQTSDVIGPGRISAVEVISQGIHCRRQEIILTLKTKQRVCVTPGAAWIQLLLHKLVQSKTVHAVQFLK